MNLTKQHQQHLDWMYENQPDLVRELHHHRKLSRHLEDKNQQALRLAEQFQKSHGLTTSEALEAAGQVVLSPDDGPAVQEDPAPLPVPWKEQQEIEGRLEGEPDSETLE
jgi:hypothetical protein